VGIPLDLGYKSWYQNARFPVLSVDENCVILRSLLLSQYQHVTDGQTDRWTDMLPMPMSCCSIAELDNNISNNSVDHLNMP